MPQTFVQKVRSQTWYPQVASSMANAGVPEYAWVGVLYAENAGLDPKAAVPEKDGTTSYGLFQFNQNPRATDPAYAASLAAPRMKAHLQQLGPNPSSGQVVTALEDAGWPGLSTTSVAQAEYSGRLDKMNAVIAQENQLPPSLVAKQGAADVLTDPNPGDNALQKWIYDRTAVGPAEKTLDAVPGKLDVPGVIANATKTVTDALAKFGQQSLQVAIALAVVAGGFALLSSGGGDE